MTFEQQILFSKALHSLMPLGGYVTTGQGMTASDVIILADGVANGYSSPTQEQIDAAIAAVE